MPSDVSNSPAVLSGVRAKVHGHDTNLGDIERAGKLSLIRGVDLSPRYFCHVFNITGMTQQVPKGSRSYMLWGTDMRKDRSNKIIASPTVEVDGKLVKYEIGANIPSTVIDTYLDQLGKRQVETQDGEEVAKDIICPEISPVSDNNDLSKWGCGYFKRLPGELPVPTEDEIRPVVLAYEDNMRAWAADGDKCIADNRPADVNFGHVRAWKYFGMTDRPGVHVIQQPVECPGCGEKLRKNALRHTVQSGGCGYVAPENRKRAFELGLVSREEAEMWDLIPSKTAEAPKPAETENKKSGRF